MTTRSSGIRFHENVHGVYFDDLDALGILHNARYLLLVERTIGSFWQRLTMGMAPPPPSEHLANLGPSGVAGQQAWVTLGSGFLVRTNSIEYVRPVTGTGEVRVRVWIDKLGTTSLTFGFAVLPMDQDLDYALGTRVVVHVDNTSRRPAPWTDPMRKALAPFVRPEALPAR